MNLPTDPILAQLRSMQEELAGLRDDVRYLTEARRQRDAFLDEMQPIFKEMMSTATQRFGALEERGYFTFARELARVVDKVVQSYGEADVRALGDNIIRIVDTLRAVTQPAVLAVANEATDVIEHADELEPTGLLGAVRASRDEDVRRGMAVMLGILRSVGRGVKELENRRDGAPQPEPPRALKAPPPPPPAPRQAPPPPAMVVPPPVAGVAFDAAGYLANPADWTAEIAGAIAAAQGISALDARHWQILMAARGDYQETGASPNIRRLTKICDTTTKELYALFPKAPGMTIARIAGIPKPAGCI